MTKIAGRIAHDTIFRC